MRQCTSCTASKTTTGLTSVYTESHFNYNQFQTNENQIFFVVYLIILSLLNGLVNSWKQRLVHCTSVFIAGDTYFNPHEESYGWLEQVLKSMAKKWGSSLHMTKNVTGSLKHIMCVPYSLRHPTKLWGNYLYSLNLGFWKKLKDDSDYAQTQNQTVFTV